MNPENQKVKTHSLGVRVSRLTVVSVALLTVLAVGALVFLRPPRAAAQGASAMSIASLQGPWALSLVGNTGCGASAMYVTFDLNAAGVDNNATIQGSSVGCGAETTTGLTFQIHSLNQDGSGTAGLTCGPSCGWALTIQVMRPLAGPPQLFSATDVSPENPDNVLGGTAIRKGEGCPPFSP